LASLREKAYQMKKILLLFTLSLYSWAVFSQAGKKKISLKDTLDGAFDLSEYIIHANGFIPIPYIITEPALGGFGLAVAPVFINKNAPIVDTIDGKTVFTRTPPDITGGLLAYTANKTWMLAGFRSGMLVKSRIKYLIGGGYANINMKFYRSIPNLGEKSFEFNLQTVPIILQGIKRIGFSKWYAGLKYLFLKTQVNYEGNLPDFVSQKETNSLVSQLGGVIELDSRDNTFTPDIGAKVHFDANYSANFLGSDYEFWKLNYYSYLYRPLFHNLILGLRLDGQQAFGNPPFYLLPYLDMRGIPIEKYQGNADVLTEAEARWDFTYRWSAVGFGGTGKAFNEWSEFGSADWIFTYGAGFRYLIAREFKLRMGVDIAHGPDSWAYYIVFGSNWLK
jgi:Omp85 superfamily domain